MICELRVKPHFFELEYVKAADSEDRIAQKEKDGIARIQSYLQSDSAVGIRNLQAYVLVFQKDRCVRKRKCE
jgi:hypothetical protein